MGRIISLLQWKGDWDFDIFNLLRVGMVMRVGWGSWRRRGSSGGWSNQWVWVECLYNIIFHNGFCDLWHHAYIMCSVCVCTSHMGCNGCICPVLVVPWTLWVYFQQHKLHVTCTTACGGVAPHRNRDTTCSQGWGLFVVCEESRMHGIVELELRQNGRGVCCMQ